MGLNSCRSTAPSLQDAAKNELSFTKENISELLGKIAGDIESPRFSADGKFLVFTLKNFPQHSHSQVYEAELKTNQLKRLTFQPVNNFQPFYSPDQSSIFFSSSIDEAKEHAHEFLREIEPKASLTSDYEPTELYQLFRGDSQIQRLTKSMGFDGHGDIAPSGNWLVFSSFKNGKINLVKMDLKNKKIITLTDPRDSIEDIQARISPDEKRIIWVRKNPQQNESQIWMADVNGENSKPLTTAPATHQHPSWTLDSNWILFSSDRSQRGHFSIYAMNIEIGCIQKIIDFSDKDLYPAISPSDHGLVFISQLEQKFVLLSKPNIPPLSCERM